MGLFGGKDKKAKTKSHRRGGGDGDTGTQRKTNRKSRRIAAPTQAGGSNTRRTSRKIQVPSENTAPAAKPASQPAPAQSDTSSSKPLDLQSGQDDLVDNSVLAEPGINDGVDELLLDSSAEAKAPVIGTQPVAEVGGISHGGDQALIDFLINKVSMITDEQAEQMRQRAEAQDLAIDAVGVQMELFTEDGLVNALTQECWVPHLKVDKYDIRKKALDTIDANDAKKYSVLPVDKLGGILNLAMVNPLDAEAIRHIEQKTGLDVKKVVATRSEIDQGIAKYYGGEVELEDKTMSISQDLEPQRVTQMLSKVADADEPMLGSDETEDIPDIGDIADIEDIEDIADIDDLLGDEVEEAASVQPAIIESFSVEQDDIDDGDEIEDIDVVAPGIVSPDNEISLDDDDLELDDAPEPAITASEPAPALDEFDDIDDIDGIGDLDTVEAEIDLDDDDDEDDFIEPDISPAVASPTIPEPELELEEEPVLAAPEPALAEPELAPELDLEPEPAVAAAPAVPDIAPELEPEPVAAAPEPAPVPAPAAATDERPGSMLKKDPATSRFKAPAKKASSEVVDLTEVLEEEFQHAITHSKSHVFEKWSALQVRNRILNAVSIPEEMDEMLASLDDDDKQSVTVDVA